MTPKKLRAAAVRQALIRRPRAAHTESELQLLTQYVLGHLSLEQVTHRLRALGQALPLGQPSRHLA